MRPLSSFAAALPLLFLGACGWSDGTSSSPHSRSSSLSSPVPSVAVPEHRDDVGSHPSLPAEKTAPPKHSSPEPSHENDDGVIQSSPVSSEYDTTEIPALEYVPVYYWDGGWWPDYPLYWPVMPPPVKPPPPHRPDRPPHRPDRPPHRPDRPPQRPDRPPHRPDRPPHRPDRPPQRPDRPDRPSPGPHSSTSSSPRIWTSPPLSIGNVEQDRQQLLFQQQNDGLRRRAEQMQREAFKSRENSNRLNTRLVRQQRQIEMSFPTSPAERAATQQERMQAGVLRRQARNTEQTAIQKQSSSTSVRGQAVRSGIRISSPAPVMVVKPPIRMRP